MKIFLLTVLTVLCSVGISNAQTLKSELKSIDVKTKTVYGDPAADKAALQRQEQNPSPDIKRGLVALNKNSTTNNTTNSNSYTPDKKSSVGISNQQIKRDIANTSSAPRTNNNNNNNKNVDTDKLKTL